MPMSTVSCISFATRIRILHRHTWFRDGQSFPDRIKGHFCGSAPHSHSSRRPWILCPEFFSLWQGHMNIGWWFLWRQYTKDRSPPCFFDVSFASLSSIRTWSRAAFIPSTSSLSVLFRRCLTCPFLSEGFRPEYSRRISHATVNLLAPRLAPSD